MNIDRAGSFRGKILDRGIGETKNHYPQLVLQLQATEHWDDANEVWESWDYDVNEATAYICLFGKDGKATLGVQQAMKALGWDGASLMTLQTDTATENIQWRMEPNTYENVTRLQVAWIDAYDAEPGRKVRKLDVTDLKKMDAKYSAALKAIGGGPKPASAPPRPPAPSQAPKPAVVADPTPSPSGTPTTTPVPTPTTSESAEPPFAPDLAPVVPPEKPKRGRKPAAPASPAVPATAAVVSAPTAPVDQATAWRSVYVAGKTAGRSDVQITQTWLDVINTIGGDEQVGDDWSGVRDQVTAKLGA
jgi:hypothetical protein